MQKRETCYFCTSTYQLYSILSLAEERQEEADLYIDPQFQNAEIIAERVKKTGLFNQVIVIDSESIFQCFFTKRRGFLNHIQIVKSYLYVDEIAEAILGSDILYSNVFISSRAYIPRIVLLHYIKNHLSYNTYYFDDGIGSYYTDSAYAPRKTDAIVRRVLFGKKANKTNYDRFLFSPDLYQKINPKSKINIFEIKKVWNKPGMVEVFDDVFGFNENTKPLQKNVIILEEPFQDLFSNENRKKIETYIDELVYLFGRENVIIKKHPRNQDNNERITGVEYYSDYSIPFETLCMNSDLQNKVLITYGSTAVATPKILLEQEPYVIVLSGLVESRIQSTILDSFFTQLKETYLKKECFCIPHSKEDLDAFLLTMGKMAKTQ